MRLCVLCKKPIEPDNDYGACWDCQEQNECPHGNPLAECNECFIESDLAYDN